MIYFPFQEWGPRQDVNGAAGPHPHLAVPGLGSHTSTSAPATHWPVLPGGAWRGGGAPAAWPEAEVGQRTCPQHGITRILAEPSQHSPGAGQPRGRPAGWRWGTGHAGGSRGQGTGEGPSGLAAQRPSTAPSSEKFKRGTLQKTLKRLLPELLVKGFSFRTSQVPTVRNKMEMKKAKSYLFSNLEERKNQLRQTYQDCETLGKGEL